MTRSLLIAIPFLASVGFSQTLPVPPGFVVGSKWGSPTLGTPATVTWSFQATGPNQVALSSFMPAGYEQSIRDAFGTWSSVSNIDFVEVASGGQIKLFGQNLGLDGASADALYPGSGSSRVRFNTSKTWTPDSDTRKGSVYEVTLHELGHAIGLAHPPGVIAAMDHAGSPAFDGLLPVDIAGAQAIYGIRPGFDNSLYVPHPNTTFTVLPGNEFTISISVGDVINISDTTTIAGTFAGRIQYGPDGNPAGVALYEGSLNIGDIAAGIDNGFLSASAAGTGMAATVFHNDWFGPVGHLTEVINGQFDVSHIVAGLINGQVQYSLNVPSLGLSKSGLLSLYDQNTLGAGPQSMALDAGFASLIRNGDMLDFDIPLNAERTLELPISGSLLPVTLRLEGTLHAQAVVPEVSTLVLSTALGCLGIISGFHWASRKRRQVATASL